MQPGPIMTIKFKYWGESEEAVKDRLPTAKEIKREGNIVFMEAKVFGCGIKMWLLSQAQYLEVIYPSDFRQEMKDTIAAMLDNY